MHVVMLFCARRKAAREEDCWVCETMGDGGREVGSCRLTPSQLLEIL